MKRFTTRFRLPCLISTLALALLLATASGGRATALANSSPWTIIPSSNPSAIDVLTSVSAVSRNDVWAVGYQSNPANPALIEHWNGAKWSVVPTPALTNSNEYYLRSVAAISATDVWAVGYYFRSIGGNEYTLIEHWNGSKWSVVANPNPGPTDNWLGNVTAVSRNDVWAVGWYENNSLQRQQVLIEHWNGITWSVMPSPTRNVPYMELTGLAVVTANDIWGVGNYLTAATETDKTLIEHWNGTAWSIVPSPNPSSGTGSLGAVSTVSARNIWAAGSDGLIEHWNGTTWSVIPSPNHSPLAGIAAVSASDIWAVGSQGPAGGVFHTLIEHWNGTKWSVVPGPSIAGYSYLNGVTRVPGTSAAWTVGAHFTDPAHQSDKTLTEYHA